jgi:hypothetical protein
MSTHIINFPGADINTAKLTVGAGGLDVYGGTFVVNTQSSSVGIGKTNPESALDVTGDLNFSGSLYQGGSLFVTTTGNVIARSLTTTSSIGIRTSAPAADLHVNGGTIINSDQVAKKTYAYTGTLANGQTTTNATIKITFSNYVFYAKVVAHLVDGTGENVSTLVFECGGGKWDGTTPVNNVALGPSRVFGVSDTNPWNSSITRTPTTVSFQPTNNMTADGYYNVFIEYISQSSSGVITKITEGSTDKITFTY